MKKILSVLLAIAMITSLSAFGTVFAAGSRMAGDVDGNGTVEAADARLALRAAVGLETLDEEQFAAADVETNDLIEAADARLILRAAVGLETLHTHEYGAWQKTAKDSEADDYHYAYCVGCDAFVTEEHAFELVVLKESTCTQTGRAYYKCKVCGLSKDPFTTNVSHEWEVLESKEATCYEDGSVKQQCKLCSQIETKTIPGGHVPGAEATCTAPQKCTRCGETLAEAPGHTLPATVSVGVTKGVNCTVCGEEVIPSFNGLVNVLKSETGHTYSGFDKTVSEFKEPKFTGLFLLMKDMFKEEFADSIGTTEDYSRFEEKSPITKSAFHLAGKEVVSELTDSNVKSIKTEKVSAIDFVKDLPGKYTVGSKTYDLNKYKTAVPGDLYKVTVTLKTERYSELKSVGGSDGIGKIYSDFGDMLNLTFNSLSADEFDGLIVPSGDAVSDATVVYYFYADTLAPAAACYNVKMAVNETMSIYLTDDFEPSDKPTGSVVMDINNTVSSYYFFDSFADN